MPSPNSPDKMIQASVTVPLRLILIVPLVLQIFLAVGLTGLLWWGNGQKSVNDLTKQLISEVAARVEQQVKYLDLAPDRFWSVNSNEDTQQSLQEFKRFLQRQKIAQLGEIAIVERSGNIVISSATEFSVNQTSDPAALLRDRPDQLIVEAIKYLQLKHGDRLVVNQSHLYRFDVNGNWQWLQVKPIADDRGLGWFVSIVIPEQALMPPIHANDRIAIVFGLALLGLTGFISLMTTELIRRPLGQLSEASRAISIGHFTQTVGKSFVTEFNSLAQDFNQMSQHLQTSFDQLESHSQQLSEKLLEMNEAVDREKRDRQIVEQQLQTSEHKIRAFFEAMNDIIIVLDTDGNIEIAPTNPSVLYEPDTDIIGLTIEHLFQDDNFLTLQEKIQQVLVTQKTLNFDYSLHVDDQERWFTARMSPMSNNSAIWVARDISDRKEAELALHLAQQQSESLLLNILPKTIAEQLKQSTEAIAEHFDEATILFSDIVGFTPLSARLSAIELVNLLNDMFSKFDRLAERYKLEKIKTIGDAYMVAAGLPVKREDHALAIAEMALDMQAAIEQFSIDNREDFQIRIGIHSGPVVAGVIGMKKFIYDLWGDTVNVASRMESSGLPGKIQLTADTYELLKNRYILEERGQISVKGKGDMMTYWLIDRKLENRKLDNA